MTYRITIDKDACTGIFACLVRDERFVEDEDGLATLDGEVRREGDSVIGEFESGIEAAREAATACPPNAITVTEVDSKTRDTDKREQRGETTCQ